MCQSCARAHVCILYLMSGGKTKQANKIIYEKIAFMVLKREYTLYH